MGKMGKDDHSGIGGAARRDGAPDPPVGSATVTRDASGRAAGDCESGEDYG